MNRATFFKQFELLADQPDGVAKMRELVLELAVRGQLVERNTKDEPAAKLLEKIKTEKREFLRASKLKEADALPQISADEAPFKCPSAWEWVRLGLISNRIHYGYTASADHSQQDVRLLRITDIQDNQVNWETVPGCQISAQEVAKYALHDNDILIARTGGTIGKTFLVASVAVKAVFASYLIRVIPSSQVSARYLKLFLESPCYWRQLLAKSAGTGQPNVNGEALSGLCVSLPPLAEQRRIVAKVDELMALCDELEQRQQARQHASGLLQQSALHHLLAAREPQTFAAAWQRVRDHFHLLHDTPDAIPQLRQAILQLAVQGRLVEHDVNDESATALMQRIQTERERLLRVGKTKKLNGQQDHKMVKAPYPLPLSWECAPLSALTYKITDGDHITPKRDSSGRYLLSARNVRNEGIDLSDVDFVPEDEYKRIRLRCDPDKGDILISCSGSVGRVAIVDRDDTYVLVRSAAFIKFPQSLLSAKFLAFALRSPICQKQMAEKSRASAQANLFLGKIGELVVPIPPLAEQKRIVARVEELLRWCDTLEAQLHQTRTLGAHLLASTLHHLLAA